MSLEQVKTIDIPSHEDNRGILSSIEQITDIPIEIKRIFYMHHIWEARGGHAHIDTDQVIIPIFGNFNVKVYDKTSSSIFFLNNPIKGLYIPRLIFVELYNFSENAICLVLANTIYDINKSLRSKDEYFSYFE